MKTAMEVFILTSGFFLALHKTHAFLRAQRGFLPFSPVPVTFLPSYNMPVLAASVFVLSPFYLSLSFVSSSYVPCSFMHAIACYASSPLAWGMCLHFSLRETPLCTCRLPFPPSSFLTLYLLHTCCCCSPIWNSRRQVIRCLPPSSPAITCPRGLPLVVPFALYLLLPPVFPTVPCAFPSWILNVFA